MKTVSTISRWEGIEPPDIDVINREMHRLRLAFLIRRIGRWFRLPRRLRRWLTGYARSMAMPLACAALVFLMAHSDLLLRWIDPTAGVIDVGALSLVLLAVAATAIFLAVSRWLLGLLWPILRDYQRYHFSNNFKSLSPWQKITFYLVIFFGLLYAFVCCLVAVF